MEEPVPQEVAVPAQPAQAAIPGQEPAVFPIQAFALTPGRVNPTEVLDYRQSAAVKLFNKATAKLEPDFDMKPEGLKDFLSTLQNRASTYGWEDILMVPEDPAFPHINLRSLTSEYGRISLTQVKDLAAIFIGQPTRAAQDDEMLRLCILATLTKEARDKIHLLDDETTVNGVPSGIATLKVIIRESHVDTNATVRFIRENLSSLDTYMQSVDSDITKFNQYVQNQMDSLRARGADTHDLLANLFKGYAAASDKVFTVYMQKRQDDYDDGIDIKPDELMRIAQNKYKSMVEGNKWKAPDAQEEKIIALEAKIQKLTAFNKSKAGNRRVMLTNKGGAKGAKAEPDRKPKPAWMTQKPNEGQPHKKTVDGKIYHWCPKHESWTRHSPQDCRKQSTTMTDLSKTKGKGGTRKPPATNPKKNRTPKMELSKALQSVMEADLEDEVPSDSEE